MAPLFGRRRYARVGHPTRVDKRTNALTASGYRVTRGKADMMRRLVQPWQARAFAYYDLLGEIKYASQFYSRSLSNLELYAAELDADGELVRTENPEAVAQLDRIQDPGGGRTGLLASYGRLMFLAGEGYLLVSRNPETEMEQWEMLSTDELRIQSGVMLRYKAPSLLVEEYREPSDDDWVPMDDREAVAYRIWQRHPRWSELADSTMQGVLDTCEELLLLTQAVRARARSRLAGSGVLLIDDRIATKPLEANAPDEDAQEDPFVADLTEAMTAPIIDEGSAAAVVPLTLRFAVPEGAKVEDMMHHLQIIDPTQLYPETGLRAECIHRIAIGLDMPPEVLEGLTDISHWGAWQVDENTWKAHLQPKAQQLCDDLTSAFYRPTLKQAGVKDWQRFCIAYDAAKIVNHPDRTKDARDLFDRGAIGLAALREAAGFDEDDAPTEQDRAERIGIATRDSSLAWYGIPSIKAGGIEPEAGVVEQAGQPVTGTPTGATTGAEVEPGPPKTSVSAPETVLGAGRNGHEQNLARLLGAADLAVLRAREAAGNRLRSLAKRDPEALRLIKGARAGQVAVCLGPDKVRALGAPSERQLVAGARDLILDALAQFGIADEAVAGLVADSVEQHAARTLYEKRPGPMPASFANYLTGLLTPA